MIKVIEDAKKIDMVSDFVTGVIEKNKDFKSFNGAYNSCSQVDNLTITLKLITSGFYKPVYSEEALDELCEKTGYYVTNGSVTTYYNKYGSKQYQYKNGKVYDKYGKFVKQYR